MDSIPKAEPGDKPEYLKLNNKFLEGQTVKVEKIKTSYGSL